MLNLDDIQKYLDKIIEDQELIVYKPIGMTPKEIVDIILDKTGAKKGCFVGRLDPIAFGAQHILLNEKCRLAKDMYERNKTYRFKIIFGIETTSLDLLGIPKISSHYMINIVKIIELLEICKKDYVQQLPIFSSYRVSNKDGLVNPLWWWAKNNRIDEVEIPKIKKELYEYTIGKLDTITCEQLKAIAITRIDSIKRINDFNQDFLIQKWENLEYVKNELYPILEIQVKVSTGFYIRQLVEDIGKYLNVKTTTFEIERLDYF
jgi:tRNA U55 pseudouridine synthase TruB